MAVETVPPDITPVYTPKLLTVLGEGYGLGMFRQDAIAGLTVAIVALPLSMAIAIASHAAPAAGLYSAVIGGFLVSALGGSRYQVGGPAGAFIVLIAATIDRYGFDGLLIATIMAGAIMFILGLFRLGNLVRLIPHGVVLGFSVGIALIIFASQIKELAGLQLAGTEPAAIIPKSQALWQAVPTVSSATLALAALSLGLIALVRKFRPHWPGFLIAVALCSVVAAFANADIATIGTRFGGIPSSLPMPQLPVVTWHLVVALFPTALSIALLGSIESLLSAVVADTMKGRRHRSNAELLAQGVANMVAPLFGGITVTGTIARTATNVRAGAHGPVAGIMHAVFLLLFIVLAAPLASYIPLPALAAVLTVVAWNMTERSEVARLIRHWPTALVFIVTLSFTLFRDLTEAIIVGTILSYILDWFVSPDSRAKGP